MRTKKTASKQRTESDRRAQEEREYMRVEREKEREKKLQASAKKVRYFVEGIESGDLSAIEGLKLIAASAADALTEYATDVDAEKAGH